MMILSLCRPRLRLFHNNTTILILMLVYLKIEEISNRLCSLHYVLTTKGITCFGSFHQLSDDNDNSNNSNDDNVSDDGECYCDGTCRYLDKNA